MTKINRLLFLEKNHKVNLFCDELINFLFLYNLLNYLFLLFNSFVIFILLINFIYHAFQLFVQDFYSDLFINLKSPIVY